MAQTEEALTLYQRLGGKDAIAAAVDIMYEFMAKDPVDPDTSVYRHFKYTDMGPQRRHLVQVIIAAADGPSPEEHGRPSIEEAHYGRGITHEDHTMTVAYFAAALGKLGVGQPELGEAVHLAESLRPLVVQEPLPSLVQPTTAV